MQIFYLVLFLSDLVTNFYSLYFYFLSFLQNRHDFYFGFLYVYSPALYSHIRFTLYKKKT